MTTWNMPGWAKAAVMPVITVLGITAWLHKEINELGHKFDSKMNTGRSELSSLHTELKADIAALDARVEDMRTDLKADIAALGARVEDWSIELKADSAAMDGEIDAARSQLSAKSSDTGGPSNADFLTADAGADDDTRSVLPE